MVFIRVILDGFEAVTRIFEIAWVIDRSQIYGCPKFIIRQFLM
jgi:hypothetical protein